ncbi:hypothetical protein PT2222_140386 [Paraburkholderia tropica]
MVETHNPFLLLPSFFTLSPDIIAKNVTKQINNRAVMISDLLILFLLLMFPLAFFILLVE